MPARPPRRSLSAADLDASRLTAGLRDDPAPRGMTPNEAARYLRVSPDRVRSWIARGILGAINTADLGCGRPRWVILPHHLAEFARRRAGGPPPKPARQKQRATRLDYFPDD